MSMKNPLTPAGIEPPTFQFVAQHINHCATVVPWKSRTVVNFAFKTDEFLSKVCYTSHRKALRLLLVSVVNIKQQLNYMIS